MSSKLLIVILSTLVLITALIHTANGWGRGCNRGGPTDNEYGSGGRTCTRNIQCCSGYCMKESVAVDREQRGGKTCFPL